MGIIIKLAPLGVLGAIAFTVGKYGIGSLKQLGMLVALFFVAVTIFVVVVLGAIMRLSGFSIFKLLRYLREELMVVFATTSATACCRRSCPSSSAWASATRRSAWSSRLATRSISTRSRSTSPWRRCSSRRRPTRRSAMTDLLTILAISLVTSKGAHGVPGSAIVVLAATLQAIPAIPAIGLVLVLSVDWFMGIARALGNLIGNCVATVAIAAWEGDIDHVRAHAVLDGRAVPPTEDDLDVAATPIAASGY